MKRTEGQLQEALADLSLERSTILEHEKSKILLERSIKDLQGRIFDLESCALTKDNSSAKRLETRIDELTHQLEVENKEKADCIKNIRKLERTVRDYQFQLQEKDKLKGKYEDESDKLELKFKKTKSQLDELQVSESHLQLSKKRAEREASEFRERSLQYFIPFRNSYKL